MANLENTDYVHETYLNMNREEMQEELKGDKFYNYFYNLLENGSNYCKFSNARLVKASMKSGCQPLKLHCLLFIM